MSSTDAFGRIGRSSPIDDEPNQQAVSPIGGSEEPDPDDPALQDEVAARLMAAAARLRAGLDL